MKFKTIAPEPGDPNLPRFEFAGFTFPKYVWTLPGGAWSKRLEHARRQVCGPYYHAPTPNGQGGTGFYLDYDGAPGLRWKWADDVEGVRINHRGWYSDEFGDAEKIRGIVLRLPRSRGFLAGWSMGEGMASAVELDIYDDEADAARAADSIAERVAEKNREYEAEEREKKEQAEKARIAEAAEEVASVE